MNLHEFERIKNYAHRMRVPGGWIYSIGNYNDSNVNQVFVPEPPRCRAHNDEHCLVTCNSCMNKNVNTEIINALFKAFDEIGTSLLSRDIKETRMISYNKAIQDCMEIIERLIKEHKNNENI